MIRLAEAAACCESILGSMPKVRVSTGVFAVTVLLADEPVITLTPVAGQLMVATRSWLRARPRQSSAVVHHSNARDSDWQSFTTGRLSVVAATLHASRPGIEYRSGLSRRIAARLVGARGTPLAQTDPRYWLALARWADGSALLARQDGKFARLYARKLRTGATISSAFRKWAMRTAADAEAAGFTATAEDLLEAIPEVESSDEDFDERAQATAWSGADEPGLARIDEPPLPGAIQELLDLLGTLDGADVTRLAAQAAPEDDQRRRARIAMYRTAGSRDRVRATAAVSLALSNLEARSGMQPNLTAFKGAALDAAAALALDGRLDADLRRHLIAPWEALAAVHRRTPPT
jgi:hypothetical protein